MSVTISKRSHSVSSTSEYYVCYCCLACGSPVIAHLTTIATYSGIAGGLFGVQESVLAEEASADQIKLSQDLLNYLADPKTAPYPVGTIYGMDTSCPACGSKEPWQDRELTWKAEASGPIEIFDRLDDAYAWMQQTLRERKTRAEESAKDPAVREADQARYRQLEEEIRTCEAEKVSGPAAMEADALTAKEADLQARFKAASMLSKEKKQLKEELESCQKALANAQKQAQLVSQQMEARAAGLQREEMELMLFEKPVLDRVLCFEAENRMAFRLLTGEEDPKPERTLSLSPLPEIIGYTVSQFETANRDAVLQTAAQLNTSLRLAREKKEDA